MLVLAGLVGVPVSAAAYGFLKVVAWLQDGLFTELPEVLGFALHGFGGELAERVSFDLELVDGAFENGTLWGGPVTLGALGNPFGDGVAVDVVDGAEAFACLVESLGDVGLLTTDGRIKALDLTVLEDDLGYFPAYNVSPVFFGEFSDKYPGIEDVFAKIAPLLTDEALQAMRDCERICRYLHVPAQSGTRSR